MPGLEDILRRDTLEIRDFYIEFLRLNDSQAQQIKKYWPKISINQNLEYHAALLFSNGKIVCTGTKSIAQVKKVIQAVIKQLKKINVKITTKPKITVQNIVASGTINLKLNLNFLALEMQNTEYEPEQFPGLVYKLTAAKATFLLFSNGKIVCTGTKSEKEVHAALDKLIENLKRVMKG